VTYICSKEKTAMNEKNLFAPFGTDFDLAAGVMKDPDRCIERKASSMRGHYQDATALEDLIRDSGDPLHYEVFEKDIPEEYGHLRIAISKLQPGTVAGECYMTKGHYHEVAETSEIYLCLRGSGYMLLKTEEGMCEAEAMEPGCLVYVPPYWAHRSINTGDEPLISLCIYPGEAGHNYGDIEKQGFPKRILKVDGQVKIVGSQ
jgi:glucose-6-phosphate isomerase